MEGSSYPKVEIQINNKSLHSAPNADGSRWLLWRTLPSGKLDGSFARKGIFRQSAAIVDFAVDSLGRVILVANDSGHVRVSRITQNGIPDPTFGDNGQTIVHEPYVSSVALQNDDKIVISTYNSQFGMLIRFNNDGSLDRSFDSGSVSFPPALEEGETYIHEIDIRQSDNRIVAAGFGRGEQTYYWHVWVVAPDGHLEWTGGKPLFIDSTSAGAMQVAVDADGSILAGGFMEDTRQHSHYVLVRYPAEGSTTPIDYVMTDKQEPVQDIVPTADGHVMVATTRTNHGILWRFNHDLNPDTTFAPEGRFATPIASVDLAMQDDGKIILDGSRWDNATSTKSFHSIRARADRSTVALSQNQLVIRGGAFDDHIVVSSLGDVIAVSIGNARPSLFSATRIKKLLIDSGGGDDTITLSGPLLPAIVNGGEGDDTLIGKRPNDRVTSIEHS